MKERRVKILLAILIVATLLCSVCFVACNNGETDMDVLGIHIQENAFPAVFVAGDSIDVSNAFLEVRYIDGSTKVVPITLDMIEGFDTTTTGEKTFRVIYQGVAATRSYRVVAATIIETAVKFGLAEYIDANGNSYLDISIQSIAEESEGVYAFSFQLALVGATCGNVKLFLPDGFGASQTTEGGSCKMTVYSQDGNTKYPEDGLVCRIALKDRAAKTEATLQNVLISNGEKDMTVAKANLTLVKEE